MNILETMYSQIKSILFDVKKRLNMDRYYRGNIDPWSRSSSLLEIQAAVTLIADRTYSHCLDIGTGLGHFAEGVSPYCKVCTAIDISKEAISRACRRVLNKNIDFIVSNVRTFDPRNKFDLIIGGDVLYYLGDMLLPDEFTQLIGKISSWVTEDGRLLLTHGALPSRNEDWFWHKYVKQFELNGFRLEKSEKFEQDNITWLHAVLSKP